ncbi:MAG: hypothetical protein F6K26_22885 [Moorea sp. SIO2I5]|nr:hypothetical protein [Moorena sp. SIO2I5]
MPTILPINAGYLEENKLRSRSVAYGQSLLAEASLHREAWPTANRPLVAEQVTQPLIRGLMTLTLPGH